MTKYRRKLFTLVIPLLFLGGRACADTAVITVVKGVAIVSQDKEKPWRKYDEVCIRRDGGEIGCGIVTKLTGAKAVVKLFHPVKQEPRVGDAVTSKEEEREVAAAPPEATPAPEAAKEAPKVEKKADKEPKKLLPFR